MPSVRKKKEITKGTIGCPIQTDAEPHPPQSSLPPDPTSSELPPYQGGLSAPVSPQSFYSQTSLRSLHLNTSSPISPILPSTECSQDIRSLESPVSGNPENDIDDGIADQDANQGHAPECIEDYYPASPGYFVNSQAQRCEPTENLYHSRVSRADIEIFNNPYRCSWPNFASGQGTLDPNNRQEERSTEISQGGRDTPIDGKDLNTSYGQELAEAALLHMPSVYQPRGRSTMTYRNDSHIAPPDKQQWVNRGILYAVIGVLLAFTFAGTIVSFVEIVQLESDLKGLKPTAALILGHGISHNDPGGFFNHPRVQ